jgi:hypothetical protein
MTKRRPFFWKLLSAGLVGSMRSSADTEDDAEAIAPSRGDVHSMAPAGKAILHERPMTEDEKRRVARAYTFGRFFGRWLCLLVVGSLLFALGLFLFIRVVVPSRQSDSVFNTVAWVSLAAGGLMLVAAVIVPPVILYKVLAARADVRRGRVRQTTGVLVKYSRPPARFWWVGDRRFDIVDAGAWGRYADGETLTIDCLPRNGDILKVHSGNGTFDALAHEGY